MELKTIDLLVGYMSHQLDEKASLNLQTHFKDCPLCQDFLREFEGILSSYPRFSHNKAGTMIENYVVSNMPVELIERMGRIEQHLNAKLQV